MAKPTTVLLKCRFCGKEIWAQSDNGGPECEGCSTLAVNACNDLFEVELTLHPLTEWEHSEV